MNIVSVNTSKKYKVHIGENLNFNELVKSVFPDGKIAIVTDDVVDELYGKKITDSLNYETVKFVFPNGEKSKNIETYGKLLNFLAQNHITRTDAVLALGGGVVGDIAGFAAATYLRGVKFIQVPTTLLAMVDSSVGGKTAIDLASGKNLAGAFHQPDIVLCDTTFLSTLSDEIFTDGCAEVIKYSLIYDKKLFSHLKEYVKAFDREYVISRCVEIKSEIVSSDEFESGKRQLLNYGHTVGHAIELLSKFSISHGSAVAIGMAIIAKAALSTNLCDSLCFENTISLLSEFSLPVKTSFSAGEIFDIMESDKKRKGDKITLVLPEILGKCILKTYPINQIKSFIEAGLTA